jgi:hypothetical protein
MIPRNSDYGGIKLSTGLSRGGAGRVADGRSALTTLDERCGLGRVDHLAFFNRYLSQSVSYPEIARVEGTDNF